MTAFKLLLFLISVTADLSGRYLFSPCGSDSSSGVFTVASTQAQRKAARLTGTTREPSAAQGGLRDGQEDKPMQKIHSRPGSAQEQRFRGEAVAGLGCFAISFCT